MIRFGIVGSGWRAMFYVRIAKALPDIFDMCLMLCRTQEKAEAVKIEYDVRTSCNEQDMIEAKPDFIVSAVSKQGMWETVERWMRLGIPVLSETPLSLDFDTLKNIWKMHTENGFATNKLQVAEQYSHYATHSARIQLVQSGIIGEPVSATVSCMHDYHAASVIRQLLDVGTQDVSVTGKKFILPVTDTITRYEILTEGTVSDKEQKHLIIEYEKGRVAFYDFMSDQYRSRIRNRFINIRGTRGEISDNTVYYLNVHNLPETCEIEIISDSVTQEILRIQFGKKILYEPPFGRCGLNEDETAIAVMLAGMKKYIDTGEEIYPLQEALEDAYIASLMTKAADNEWEKQLSEPRPWQEQNLEYI